MAKGVNPQNATDWEKHEADHSKAREAWFKGHGPLQAQLARWMTTRPDCPKCKGQDIASAQNETRTEYQCRICRHIWEVSRITLTDTPQNP